MNGLSQCQSSHWPLWRDVHQFNLAFSLEEARPLVRVLHVKKPRPLVFGWGSSLEAHNMVAPVLCQVYIINAHPKEESYLGYFLRPFFDQERV
jgi:hypothetical protein